MAMGKDISEAMLGVGSFIDRCEGEYVKLEPERLEELLCSSVGLWGLAFLGLSFSPFSIFLFASILGVGGGFCASVAVDDVVGVGGVCFPLNIDGLLTCDVCCSSGDRTGLST